MLEKNLEECLNNAFKFAHENNHEFVTTEHLLLCILNNQDALNVLLACDVNIDILEAELKEFISKNCPEKRYLYENMLEESNKRTSENHN